MTQQVDCQCLQRMSTCPGECMVSRNSPLHERTCGTCGYNPEAKVEDKEGRYEKSHLDTGGR